MRFLVAAVFLALAAAAPEPGPPVGQSFEPTAPTISAGDIHGAAVEAQVEVADSVRTAIDGERQVIDKVSEIQGQVANSADEQAWRAVDAVKTVEAQLDGAVARNAAAIAKNYVRGIITPGVNYASTAGYGVYDAGYQNSVYGAGYGTNYAPIPPRPASVGPVVQASAPVPSVAAPFATAAPIVQATPSYVASTAVPASNLVQSVPSYAPKPVVQAVPPYATSNPIVQSVPSYAAPSPVVQSVPSYAASNPLVQSVPPYYTSSPLSYSVSPFDYAAQYYSGYPYVNNPYLNNAYQGYYSPLGYSNFY